MRYQKYYNIVVSIFNNIKFKPLCKGATAPRAPLRVIIHVNEFRKYYILPALALIAVISGAFGQSAVADEAKTPLENKPAEKSAEAAPEKPKEKVEKIPMKYRGNYRSRIINALTARDEIELQKIEKEAEKIIPPEVKKEIEAKGNEIRKRWDNINAEMNLLKAGEHLFVVQSYQNDNVYSRPYDAEKNYDSTKSERANRIRQEMRDVTKEEQQLFQKILSYLDK